MRCDAVSFDRGRLSQRFRAARFREFRVYVSPETALQGTRTWTETTTLGDGEERKSEKGGATQFRTDGNQSMKSGLGDTRRNQKREGTKNEQKSEENKDGRK